MDQDYGFGFDFETAMPGQKVEQVDPVTEAIFIGRAA